MTKKKPDLKLERALVDDRKGIISRYDSYTRDELINQLDLEVSILPEEVRESVRFEIDMKTYEYDDREYPQLFMTWKRYETDKEMNERIRKLTLFEEAQKKRELTEYKRLEKIYGKKKETK